MIYGNKVLNLIGRNKENKEQLLNEYTIYRGKGILITVDGSGATERDFDSCPYMKVYNNESQKKADMVARINIEKPKYVYHKDHFKDWDMNSSDRNKLDEIMDEKPNGKEFKNCNTVFDAINKAVKMKTNNNYIPKFDSSNRPSFTEIKEGRKRK